ncbi:MAG: lipase [Bacillales bacterium]|jgi:lysophospholipase L1-like esterase|nr:lipase [Bacillales bacterium]
MRSFIIKSLVVLSIMASGIMIYGFINGALSVNGKETKTSENTNKSVEKNKDQDQKDEQTLSLVGLGDSLTRGVGDDKGAGYFDRLKTALSESQKKTIVASNLSVSGAKSKDLLLLLNDKGVQYTINHADVIVMTMGGNDLSPGMGNLTSEFLATYQPDIATFTTDAKTILETIRSNNSNAPIYWVSLFNPYEGLKGYEKTSEAVMQWNLALEKVTGVYPNVYVVPSLDLFKGKVPAWLYVDKYHPNGKGYQAITERLLPIILTNLKGIESNE